MNGSGVKQTNRHSILKDLEERIRELEKQYAMAKAGVAVLTTVGVLGGFLSWANFRDANREIIKLSAGASRLNEVTEAAVKSIESVRKNAEELVKNKGAEVEKSVDSQAKKSVLEATAKLVKNDDIVKNGDTVYLRTQANKDGQRFYIGVTDRAPFTRVDTGRKSEDKNKKDDPPRSSPGIDEAFEVVKMKK